ncbi:hypothetical protein G7054_g634 [Neopestalotiopsis clavispora]|nr:hypothetical protein G7054_g634 [Neopestalotiopsis clavispora]
MDPTSALGTAAASAQFLGYGIKGLVYAAQLIRDIKGAPDDSLRIVTRLEKEITSMNRLLSPDSSTFSQFTTAQYVHIAPWALDAKKALDGANRVLSSLSSQLDDLNNKDGARKRVLQTWKSLLTVKAIREVENQLESIQMLNASLVRELHVAGFETQYLLREQSTEVLAKVVEITTVNDELRQRLSNLSSQQDKASQMLMASSTSVLNGLEKLDQANDQRQFNLVQGMSSIGSEISAVRSELQMIDEHSKALNLSMERVGTAVTDQNRLLEMQLRNLIHVQCAENQTALVEEIKKMLVTDLLTTVHHFAGDHRHSTKSIDSITIAKSPKLSHTTRSPIFVGCLCKRDKVS